MDTIDTENGEIEVSTFTHSHRYMILPIPYTMLLNIFAPISEVNIIKKIKLPKDAHVVSVSYKPESREWLVFLESKEFDIIEEGWELPRLEFDDIAIMKYQITEIGE